MITSIREECLPEGFDASGVLRTTFKGHTVEVQHDCSPTKKLSLWQRLIRAILIKLNIREKPPTMAETLLRRSVRMEVAPITHPPIVVDEGETPTLDRLSQEWEIDDELPPVHQNDRDIKYYLAYTKVGRVPLHELFYFFSYAPESLFLQSQQKTGFIRQLQRIIGNAPLSSDIDTVLSKISNFYLLTLMFIHEVQQEEFDGFARAALHDSFELHPEFVLFRRELINRILFNSNTLRKYYEQVTFPFHFEIKENSYLLGDKTCGKNSIELVGLVASHYFPQQLK